MVAASAGSGGAPEVVAKGVAEGMHKFVASGGLCIAAVVVDILLSKFEGAAGPARASRGNSKHASSHPRVPPALPAPTLPGHIAVHVTAG